MKTTFRTTATSALEIETVLPPTDLRLQRKLLHSFIRMKPLAQKPHSHMHDVTQTRAATADVTRVL